MLRSIFAYAYLKCAPIYKRPIMLYSLLVLIWCDPKILLLHFYLTRHSKTSRIACRLPTELWDGRHPELHALECELRREHDLSGSHLIVRWAALSHRYQQPLPFGFLLLRVIPALAITALWSFVWAPALLPKIVVNGVQWTATPGSWPGLAFTCVRAVWSKAPSLAGFVVFSRGCWLRVDDVGDRSYFTGVCVNRLLTGDTSHVIRYAWKMADERSECFQHLDLSSWCHNKRFLLYAD